MQLWSNLHREPAYAVCICIYSLFLHTQLASVRVYSWCQNRSSPIKGLQLISSPCPGATAASAYCQPPLCIVYQHNQLHTAFRLLPRSYGLLIWPLCVVSVCVCVCVCLANMAATGSSELLTLRPLGLLWPPYWILSLSGLCTNLSALCVVCVGVGLCYKARTSPRSYITFITTCTSLN